MYVRSQHAVGWMLPYKRQPAARIGRYTQRAPAFFLHAGGRHGHSPMAIARIQHCTSAGLYPCQCQMRGRTTARPARGRPALAPALGGAGWAKARALYSASSSACAGS